MIYNVKDIDNNAHQIDVSESDTVIRVLYIENGIIKYIQNPDKLDAITLALDKLNLTLQ